MKRKFFLFLLAAVLALEALPVAASDWTDPKAIDFVTKNKIFDSTEDGFYPNDPMTRAMIVQVLYNTDSIKNNPEPTETYAFDDISPHNWFYYTVGWGKAEGIVTGSSGQFHPDETVTRQEMMVFLYRYANFRKCDTSAKGDLSAYLDAGSIPVWAKDAMSWAVGSGTLNGKGGGNLAPQDPVSRMEVAIIMQRFANRYSDKILEE